MGEFIKSFSRGIFVSILLMSPAFIVFPELISDLFYDEQRVKWVHVVILIIVVISVSGAVEYFWILPAFLKIEESDRDSVKKTHFFLIPFSTYQGKRNFVKTKGNKSFWSSMMVMALFFASLLIFSCWKIYDVTDLWYVLLISISISCLIYIPLINFVVSLISRMFVRASREFVLEEVEVLAEVRKKKEENNVNDEDPPYSAGGGLPGLTWDMNNPLFDDSSSSDKMLMDSLKRALSWNQSILPKDQPKKTTAKSNDTDAKKPSLKKSVAKKSVAKKQKK